MDFGTYFKFLNVLMASTVAWNAVKTVLCLRCSCLYERCLIYCVTESEYEA